MEAQRRTNDFDGILALAPAINWDEFMTMGLYLYMVITLEGGIVPACVFNTFKEYTIAFCNANDGAADSVLSDPQSCKFDAKSAVMNPQIATATPTPPQESAT
ncbi:unnamed protein product [Clonostachys rhizophaga]|uniref:Carboxylic ester hydrolase n=1 Tax=Clonostachys rhizophaga TaxID=160324 RepID=A0A9N9VBN7_9HYPO|nr:unnamed protein product [Clonostachys rhizophaga]